VILFRELKILFWTLQVLLSEVPQLNHQKAWQKLQKKISADVNSALWGASYRLQSQYAALANGTTAHAIEFDDISCESSLHPGVGVMPAAFALAEELNADTKDVIAAITAGYEIMMRIGEASLDFNGNYRYFHTTGICGVFGSAMAAGKLLNLDKEQLNMVLGIAGSMASGSMEFLPNGAWTKRLNSGWAAHSGILAAKMAHGGYKGPVSIIDGDHGFLNSYTRNQRPDKLVKKLGLPSKILETKIKVYSCCRYAHASVEATVQLHNEGVRIPDIEKVRVSVIKADWNLVAAALESKYNPENVVQAQFNVPFGIAVGLKNGKAGFSDYVQETVNYEEIRNFLPRVEMYQDEELEKIYPSYWPAKMEITLKDGGVINKYIKHSRGGWPGPDLSRDENVEKFLELTDSILSKEQCRQIIDKTAMFDDLNSITEFTDLLIRNN